MAGRGQFQAKRRPTERKHKLRPRYLGDSYDIVKQSLLRWLRVFGTWKAHPMFTELVSPREAILFSQLLGVELLSSETLYQDTNRLAYFATARSCRDHLFLDPDTGLRLKPSAAKDHPSYLFGPEVITLVSERPNTLTLVFDQSLPRGQEREKIARKLAFLKEHHVSSFAYVSHACFILMSLEQELVDKALQVVQEASRLPEMRFVRNTGSHNHAIHRIVAKDGHSR